MSGNRMAKAYRLLARIVIHRCGIVDSEKEARKMAEIKNPSRILEAALTARIEARGLRNRSSRSVGHDVRGLR